MTQPVVDVLDKEHLCEAIEEADISILAMVLVQFTGDETVLDRIRPYIDGPWDYMERVPPELKRELRDRLATVLAEHAAGRRPDPPPPPPALLHKMMEACVGQKVPDEYVPMMLEQLALTGTGGHDVHWTKGEVPERARTFRVVVIGAGISGMAAAIKLKQAGIGFTVFEKNPTVGGTWLENVYPGCGVDTPNHFYSFSFEPNHDWTHYYSKRDEIYGYLEQCADKHGIRDSIRFNTEVVSAHYDDARAVWRVTVRGANGGEEAVEADAVIFAVGQLNRPSIPDIPGLASFKGAAFHTARWRTDLDLKGRRVAVIGTGASGMQVAPSIAPDVERLVIFQRTPHWVSSNPNYHRAVSEGKKWALKHVPYYANWYRFQLSWAAADGIHPSLRVDPAWTKPDVSVSAAHEQIRQTLIQRIREQIGDDEVLLGKVIPDFPPYGKRMLRDNHWYETLKRSNVDLVTDPIEEVRPDGIATATGEFHPVDVIVLATGFRANEMLAPVDIQGRGGVPLRAIWGDDDPKAYLGITVPGFPNLFVLFGPNTNYAHGGSHIFSAEGQIRYVLQGLRELIEGGYAAMECRQEVHDAYNRNVDEAHARMVWGHPKVDTWYKNRRGRVFSISPFRLFDHWKWTSTLNRDDYHWRRCPAPDQGDNR